MTSTKADELLKEYGGSLEGAIAALRLAAKTPKRKQTNKIHDPNAPVVVALSTVNKTYKRGSERIHALDNVSLDIRQGEFVAITGTSGSGKSTLLQLIGGLDKPTSGTLTIDGQDISKMSDRKLSTFRNRTIGFVFQFFYLQPFLNLQTNLEVPAVFARVPKKQRSERSRELAEAVGLADRLNHLPKELSGGQMQRAAIARALLNSPKILLADEPTGNLDQANSQAIIELFSELRNTYNTTVIIVTHDRDVAAKADREIVLGDGKVVTA